MKIARDYDPKAKRKPVSQGALVKALRNGIAEMMDPKGPPKGAFHRFGAGAPPAAMRPDMTYEEANAEMDRHMRERMKYQ